MCPGSLSMEERAAREGLVFDEDSDDAAEGTLLHALVASCATEADLERLAAPAAGKGEA